MTSCRFAATLVGTFLAVAPSTVSPGWAALDPAGFAGLAFEQHAGAALPLDAQLSDESGRATRLSALFSGRPVLVVLEYLRCPNLCGLVLGGLLDALATTPLASGRDYDVIAISIDPREGQAEAAGARRDYEERYGAEALAGWRFVTGSEAEVRRVADAVGFPYRWDETTRQYAHPAGAVAVTPAGAVSTYLFGVAFSPLDLRLALVEASEGTIAAPASRLLLLCYGYDPKSGSYQPAILNILKAAGLATVALGGAYVALQLRRDARG